MRRVRVLVVTVLMMVGAGVAWPNPAEGQSAADKATARKLATDGIQLFQQDRFADALDKLERAESLFDAPVHLLYIARCQVKLSHLVEAAEAYRRLVRTELSAQAPQTFKEAVADGQKELPEIEPKIPSLRVEVVPANAKDLRLTIDGDSVSTAVIGVDRPINPGSHVVEVAAKGQAAVQRRIDVAVASKQVVKLELGPAVGGDATIVVQATDAPSAGTSPANVVPPAADSNSGAARLTVAAAEPPRRVKIIAGLDVDATVPVAGKIDNQVGTGGPDGADHRQITERYGPGGGLELRVGLAIPIGNFALTPLLFANVNSHSPGKLYKAPADQSFGLDGDVSSVMTAKPLSQSLGIGVRFDTAPLRPFQVGGFFELDAVLRQAYVTNGTWTVAGPVGNCEFTEQFDGVGVRGRGGVLLPVSRLVTLVGSAGVTLATITSAGLTKRTCDNKNLTFDGEDKATVPTESRAVHAVFGLAVGAEFGFGL
jgi:hypothetical protein